MHEQREHDWNEVIESLDAAEKLELIEKLARSMRSEKSIDTASQKQRILERVRKIASLPIEGPGGFSGRDHDKVLYGQVT